MKNNKLLFGLILGILIGVLCILIFTRLIPLSLSITLNFLFSLIIVFIISGVVFIVFGDKIFKFLFGIKVNPKIFRERFNEDLHLFLKDLFPDRDFNKSSVDRTSSFLIWTLGRSWFFRILISIFLGLTSLIGVILLNNQNKLFEFQNQKIDIQNQLIESERRSASVFLLGNITETVNRELENNPNIRKLSPQLTGQIISLSKSLKPYRYMSRNNYLTKYTSPERGQLLIFLLESEIHQSNLDHILKNGSFDYMEILDYNFTKDTLRDFNFSNSIFSNVEFHESILLDGSLHGVSFLQNLLFNNCKIDNLNFFQNKKDFFLSEVKESELLYVTFEDSCVVTNIELPTHSYNISLKNSEFYRFSMAGTHIANIDNCRIYDSSLRFSNKVKIGDGHGAIISYSELNNTILESQDQSEVDLNFLGCNLNKVSMHNISQIRLAYSILELNFRLVESIMENATEIELGPYSCYWGNSNVVDELHEEICFKEDRLTFCLENKLKEYFDSGGITLDSIKSAIEFEKIFAN